MMKFEIHDGQSDDYVVIESDTIEEIKVQANNEVRKRGWKEPWSREIEG